MTKPKLCSRLRRMAEEYLFIEVDKTKVFYCLHDREKVPLGYWYCLDPLGIPGQLVGPGYKFTFDVRELPQEYRDGLTIEVRPYLGHNSYCQERLAHAEAIKRAITSGYDILKGQWGNNHAQ